MTTYCPNCWATVASDAVVCPRCRASLSESAGSYVTKLLRALQHPEPLTQRRAAYVLGLLQDPAAVEALRALLTTAADPYVKGEAAHALGQIGGERARIILRQVADDELQSVMVRRTAADALRDQRCAPEGK